MIGIQIYKSYGEFTELKIEHPYLRGALMVSEELYAGFENFAHWIQNHDLIEYGWGRYSFNQLLCLFHLKDF